MRESEILKLCRLAAAECGATVFRNNRGMFWTLDGSRRIRAGLEADGSADLIGWSPLTVTQDMVGQKIAVFTALEVKTAKGTIKPEQKRFLDLVARNGGIAFVARSPEDVKNALAAHGF